MKKPTILNPPDDTEIGIVKLSKDLRKTAESMTFDEARFLVDSYYQMQQNRMRADAQIRSVKDEPHAVLAWLSENNTILEKQIASALKCFAESQHMGQWAMGVTGIGPIIAAGLLAHIKQDMPTVGHIWSFAGLNPDQQWKKGEKRPFNAALKVICWKIGESFVKVSNLPDAFYGHYYKQRKEYRRAKNERGEYAANAEKMLKQCPKHAQAAIYKTGKLPDGHIHSMAKREAVKLFLSHWHGEAYRHTTGKEPPLPYPIAILGHTHMIAA